MMYTTCEKTNGLLFLIAGIAYLMFALGSLDGKNAHLVSGAAIGIAGLGLIWHGMGKCDNCGAMMKKMR